MNNTKVFSKCGMRCDLCLIYRPNVENEDRRAEICNACKKYMDEFRRGITMELKSELLGKCGFYCGTCPTYINGNCNGCIEEHMEGDCFTRDCVIEKGLEACGQCDKFPCSTIMTKPHSTVIDKEWLKWKKKSDTNR